MQQFLERPEDCISLFIFLWPRLNQEMYVIRHHTYREQFVAFVMKMPKSIQHNCASFWGEATPRFCADGHGVNRPWFFEMWQSAARIESAILRLGFERSPRRRDAVANTRDACATRSLRALKQG